MMAQEDPLLRVVADVFEIDIAKLDDSASQDTVPQWDSLGMINLIGEIEYRFNVQFDLMEMAQMKNVGIVRALLAEKGADLG